MGIYIYIELYFYRTFRPDGTPRAEGKPRQDATSWQGALAFKCAWKMAGLILTFIRRGNTAIPLTAFVDVGLKVSRGRTAQPLRC